MRNTPFWWILIGLIVLLDIYFFQAIKTISHSAQPRTRSVIYAVYWIVSVTVIILIITLPYFHFHRNAKFIRATVFAIIVALFLAKIITAVFLLIDDVRRGIQWIVTKIFSSSSKESVSAGAGISRSVFLTWTGMLIGGGLFGSLIYGFRNKYRYQVKRLSLSFPGLPASFKGLKIVHISDIHSGSFNDKQAVIHGVEMIMKEKADLVLFTGDLVNDKATEMEDYMDVFNNIKAPMGVYSTLGNHDYGDYVQWESSDAKHANLEQLKKVHADLGWRLLMNEHIVFERGTDKIALLGVENWSMKARFPKHGDLAKAHSGTENYPFKILMSHDPSHWKGQVIPSYSDIDLVLSGHTHGMQFGVEIKGFKWSPVKYFYPEWAGLYEEGRQRLYVNRGYGFLGYPGRVGILPEITVLELL